MESNRDHSPAQTTDKGGGLSRNWPYLCALGLVVVLVAVFFLKISLTNILFFGAILACPLMHLFMMKGHGHDENSGHSVQKEEKQN